MEKAKILIVEDEAITAKDIDDRLQDLNYAPTIAPSGEQAIKQADAIKPDLDRYPLKGYGWHRSC